MLNSAIHKSIKESPHFITYGCDKRLPYDVLNQKPQPIYNLDDYVRLRVSDFQKIHQNVNENLTASREDMLHRQHQKVRQVDLHEGDIVFVQVHDRNSKLDPKFQGPYRVLQHDQENKAELLILTTLERETVHCDHLKKVSRGFDTGVSLPAQSSSDNMPPAQQTSPTANTYKQKLRSHNQAKRVGIIMPSDEMAHHFHDLNIDLFSFYTQHKTFPSTSLFFIFCHS